jgi:hypothetical protein
MQSTGQTSRHASQPVQLSALMTATSFGSFFREPALAIDSYLDLSIAIVSQATTTVQSGSTSASLNCAVFARFPVLSHSTG